MSIVHNEHISCTLCPLGILNTIKNVYCAYFDHCVHCAQWTYIVRDVTTASPILIKCLLCSMNVQCVYCVHCVHYTYHAQWTTPTKTQPSTNRCRVGVSIVDNKMETMDIYFVHWTCPLVTKNEHTVSIGDQWTFSTFWYMANGRSMDAHWSSIGHGHCTQRDECTQWTTPAILVALLPAEE